MKKIDTYIVEKLHINKDTKIIKVDPVKIIKNYFEEKYKKYEDRWQIKVSEHSNKIELNIIFDNKLFKIKNLMRSIDELLKNNEINSYSYNRPYQIGNEITLPYTFYIKKES